MLAKAPEASGVGSWISHRRSCSFFTVARTLLGAPGLTTRSKDATRGSWPYY